GDRATITLGGELDMYASGVLNERLSELGDVLEIDVDAGAVTFIDSAGLRALLVAREAARDRGVALRVTSVSPEGTWGAGVTGLRVEGPAPTCPPARPVPRDRPTGALQRGHDRASAVGHRPRRRAGHPDAVGPAQAPARAVRAPPRAVRAARTARGGARTA